MVTRLILGLIFVCSCGAAPAAEFAEEMVAATFKLYHPDSTGTCILVRRGGDDEKTYLLTAAHVLERTKGDTAVLVLRQEKDDGTFERHDHTIPIRRDGKPRWIRHAKADAAVLKLDEALPVPAKPLPLELIANNDTLKEANLHLCSSIFVLTFPHRFEANSAGFPIARSGIISSQPLLPVERYPTFLADFTTFAGDSGGPTFIAGKDNHPLVIGIVLAQHRHDEKIRTENESRTIHHPLGLGTVLHAQHLREILEEAAKPKE